MRSVIQFSARKNTAAEAVDYMTPVRIARILQTCKAERRFPTLAEIEEIQNLNRKFAQSVNRLAQRLRGFFHIR